MEGGWDRYLDIDHQYGPIIGHQYETDMDEKDIDDQYGPMWDRYG